MIARAVHGDLAKFLQFLDIDAARH